MASARRRLAFEEAVRGGVAQGPADQGLVGRLLTELANLKGDGYDFAAASGYAGQAADIARLLGDQVREGVGQIGPGDLGPPLLDLANELERAHLRAAERANSAVDPWSDRWGSPYRRRSQPPVLPVGTAPFGGAR